MIRSDPERWQRELQDLDPDATVIVDLDHTLFLSNSTAEYLRSLRPRFLAVGILAALSFLKPWRLARWISAEKREVLSDPLRVMVCTLLFPWTPLLWRRRGKILGAEDANHRLIDALAKAGRRQVVVATLGARFIVEPILAGLAVETSHVVAGTFWRGDKIRRAGKAPSVVATLGTDRVAAAYFITDSTDDNDLLAKVAVPILHQWPESVHRAQLDGGYVPFRYSDRVKRPGNRHFFRQFLRDDLSLLILAIGLTQPDDFALYMALFLGLLSFHAVYEVGYHENDVLGALNEANPRLSESFDPAENFHFVPGAYLWAMATGAAAAWLAVGNDAPALAMRGLLWVGLLASVRLVFALFNRVYKARILLFPVLQSQKTFGFLILGSASPAGLALMTAQVGRRSLAYAFYRLRDGQTAWLDLLLLRLVLYLALAAVVEASRSVNLFEDWRFWVIVVWLMVRSKPDISRLRALRTRGRSLSPEVDLPSGD